MSERQPHHLLVESLNTEAGWMPDDPELQKLLRWAALHISSQDEALAESRAERDEAEAERMRLEEALHQHIAQADALCAAMRASQFTPVPLAKDYAPHTNLMAAHGVEPYARKPRKRKGETA